jgi:hypothetical protein
MASETMSMLGSGLGFSHDAKAIASSTSMAFAMKRFFLIG